jgi:transcription elongation factor S-II
MASEERKKADEAIKQQNLHDALGAEEQQAETDAFQCSKCKQVCLVSSV